MYYVQEIYPYKKCTTTRRNRLRSIAPQEIVTAKIETFRNSEQSGQARSLHGFGFWESVHGEAFALVVDCDDAVIIEL